MGRGDGADEGRHLGAKSSAPWGSPVAPRPCSAAPRVSHVCASEAGRQTLGTLLLWYDNIWEIA